MNWTKINTNDFPAQEVLAGNFQKGTLSYHEKLVGFLSLSEDGTTVKCEDDFQIIEPATHYVLLSDYDFVADEI